MNVAVAGVRSFRPAASTANARITYLPFGPTRQSIDHPVLVAPGVPSVARYQTSGPHVPSECHQSPVVASCTATSTKATDRSSLAEPWNVSCALRIVFVFPAIVVSGAFVSGAGVGLGLVDGVAEVNVTSGGVGSTFPAPSRDDACASKAPEAGGVHRKVHPVLVAPGVSRAAR